ncbi:hypothetical protein, partial [Acinetobacter baumannii]|uniref:hypothetical protein n=1 Tax=Acinetobacter baumannii TaxID=470 RepID=UPI001BC87364
ALRGVIFRCLDCHNKIPARAGSQIGKFAKLTQGRCLVLHGKKYLFPCLEKRKKSIFCPFIQVKNFNP